MVQKGCGTIGQGRVLEFLFGFHSCRNSLYLFLVGVGFALVLCVGLAVLGLPWAGLADFVWLGMAWPGLVWPGLTWLGLCAGLRSESWGLRAGS
jgi:hypothetical protein